MIALLIRHADTNAIGRVLWGRKPGLHLSDPGAVQARRLPTRLERWSISALYSSPRERAQETAAPLSVARRLSIVVNEAFDEVDFGGWSGRTIADLDPLPEWQLFNSDREHAAAPGGERVAQVQTRIVAELARLAALHPADTIAIVSHAEVIRCAVLHYLGMSLDAFQRVEISPASVTALRLEGGSATFLSINQRDDQ
jgi:broad specificity phosphatase PhoE